MSSATGMSCSTLLSSIEWNGAIEQPMQPMRWRMKTPIVAGQRRMTSSTVKFGSISIWLMVAHRGEDLGRGCGIVPGISLP